MSVHSINTIAPLFRLLKKNIRRWIITTLFLFLVMIVFPTLFKLFEEKNPYIAHFIAAVFLLFLIIILVIYFRNVRKNADLNGIIFEYKDVKKIDMFVRPYRNLEFYSQLIFFLDIFLWPITFPIKFAFWINYRILKSRFKKLRKQILLGEREINSESIEDDPFYDFLIREGLYESPMEDEIKTEEQQTPIQESSTTQEKV